MADKGGVLEIECLHESREIVRVGVHVIAGCRLRRSPMTAAIMRNTAVSMLDEEKHLRIPCVGAEWPAMCERYYCSFAPVLVINLSIIPRLDCGHSLLLYSRAGRNYRPEAALSQSSRSEACVVRPL